MSEVSLDRLLILFSAGLGLMVLGGLNYLLSRHNWYVRMSIGGFAAGVCALAPLAVATPKVSAASFGLILLGVGFLAAITAAGTTSLFHSIATFARRTSVQAAIVVGSGVALMAGSLTYYEFEEDASMNLDAVWMSEVFAQPLVHISNEESAETDEGEFIALKTPNEVRAQWDIDHAEKQVLSQGIYNERLIRVQPATDLCNCHGWVFTGGRYWLSPEDVELALKENGYQPVSDPRTGDVVIYRQGQMITHTAVVRTSGPGEQLMVEGKWGWMGVFLHRISDSPYGQLQEFYRSTRRGHVLRGLEKASSH